MARYFPEKVPFLSSKQTDKPELPQSDRWFNIKNHLVLIQDKIRNLAYKKAIESNVKNGDVVLDLGCGTGLLAFFAAAKKCKKVYAVDKSDIIGCARETAKLNKLDKNIEFIKKDILKFRPKEKIDVLVHEQIGEFLWDEDVVSKAAYVRDNFLRPGGIMIPFKIGLYLAPVDYDSGLEKSLSFLSRKRYGIDFRCLKKAIFIQSIFDASCPVRIELKDRKRFLCPGKLAYAVDLRKESGIPGEIGVSFKLKKNARLTGICGYFKVYLDEKRGFSTGPGRVKTNWGQFFLPCSEKKVIKHAATLNFTLFPKKKPRDWRFRFEIIKR